MGESQYLKNPKVGDEIILNNLKGFKKITGKDCIFSYKDEKTKEEKKASSALSSVDYGIELHTNEGKIFPIKSWSVWGQFKAGLKKLESTNGEGITVKINHLANGLIEENRKKAWRVSFQVDDKWMYFPNKEAKDWVAE